MASHHSAAIAIALHLFPQSLFHSHFMVVEAQSCCHFSVSATYNQEVPSQSQMVVYVFQMVKTTFPSQSVVGSGREHRNGIFDLRLKYCISIHYRVFDE